MGGRLMCEMLSKCHLPYINRFPLSVAYVEIYYARGQSTIIPFSRCPSPGEAILNLSVDEGGIALWLFCEDGSGFFFSLFSSVWQ